MTSALCLGCSQSLGKTGFFGDKREMWKVFGGVRSVRVAGTAMMIERKSKQQRDEARQIERDHTAEFRHRNASTQRSIFLGFEMEIELVWDNWDLGREFPKVLIIKNTRATLQRLLFRPPLSTYFTSLARQKLVVKPGASFSIPVTFKPVNRCDYDDTIEFQGSNDSFQVSLRAPAPRHAIQAPESVPLPLCAVLHAARTTFTFKNVSKLYTFFRWDYSPPFVLSQDQGRLKPGQESTVTVTFNPQEALVHEQRVSCRFGPRADELESCCSVLLQGQAKLPYLELRTPTDHQGSDRVPVLDFGGAAVGHTLHSHFEIYNPSPFPVCFSVSRLAGGIPLLGSVFGCDMTGAEVAPGASLKAAARFTPSTAKSTSVEYLSLLCKGAISASLLKLTGRCIGPQVMLSPPMVDFGIVEPGQAVTRAVRLMNSSLAEAVFQWDMDCSGNSVFSIQPPGGIVPPQSHITLKVTYKPTQSLPHYRRVACLILHEVGDVVFLDIVGNCHALTPFEQLLEESSDDFKTQQEADGMTLMSEYFRSNLCGKDPQSPPAPLLLLSIAPNEFVFNQKLFSLPENLIFQKPMLVTSHSKVKLRLEWTSAPDSSFSVVPQFCELPPLKSTSFRVTYSTKQLNSLHGAQLECFAYSMADSDQCDTSALPYSLTVRAIAHSFEPGKKHHVPQCSPEPRLVEFPPVNVALYRSVLLPNKSDLPLTFHLNPERDQKLAKAASLVVVPGCGLIPPNSHQILSVRTVPTADGPAEGFHVQLDLNAAKYTEELTIISNTEPPCVSLEDEGKVHLPPTALHSSTKRLHCIRNLSRQALRFQWRIPEDDWGLISAEPDAGVLNPNESLALMWSFTPSEEKTYTFKPSLAISPMQFPDVVNLQLPLEVTGRGCVGHVQAKEVLLEVNDVMVRNSQAISIAVTNNSPCTISFCVTAEQTLKDKELVHNPNIDQCALQFHNERVTIVSNSTVLLQSTFTPPVKAQYQWIISYQKINANGSMSPATFLCEVRAKGVYPTIQMTDVRGSGSLSQFSKMHLWTLLSLDHLNKLLQFSPCQPELTHSIPTKHSLYSIPSVLTKASVDFNFSAAPLNSDLSTFMLMLCNPGITPVEWAFLFPEDQQLDPEFLAETGELSTTELYQKKVFCVMPRSGQLRFGQQRAVKFTYSHQYLGKDRFPVLLKISFGREIMLNFQGMTVEVDRPYLHFASDTHVFDSVAIGDYNPPKQMYVLHNRGAVPLQYEVDRAVFSRVREENFDHPVLRCLNPEGEIAAGGVAVLQWIFSPLEAKLYQIDVPVRILNGESTTVTFEGSGINCRLQDLSSSRTSAESGLCWQRAPFPEQPTFLSEDSADFGAITVFSKSSKRLFLKHDRKSHDIVCYEWVLPPQNSRPQKLLDIIPSEGRLSPGQIVHFVLTLFASEYPTNYQIDIICKITSEAALRHYNEDVQHMEEQKERRKHEFTITDKTPKEKKVVLTEKEAEAVALRHKAFLNQYKTLPAICASRDCHIAPTLITNVTRAERRALRALAKVPKDPEPPKPCLLHLWVTAQSHALPESPGQLEPPDTRPKDMDKTQSPIPFTEKSSSAQCRDITSDMFCSMLRDIVEDAALGKKLLTIASTPEVYNPTPASSNKAAAEKTDKEGRKVRPVRPEVVDLVKEECLSTTFQSLAMASAFAEFLVYF
ncbi:cilia- and flagella-associated protein 65 [Eucyclogobius newberryi]|uniref:cilia- and flagella-associated protein 65 n=1 Tax=Eucyclogobius newberryi TaxID=166745 RepID=UPI003B5AFF26